MISEQRVVLVTGAARRIGAAIARALHADGWQLVLHFRSSAAEADQLRAELEQQRPGSAATVQGELNHGADASALADRAMGAFGRLDGLVNNASAYRSTPLGQLDDDSFQAMVGSNLLAPVQLVQATAARMEAGGAVVNLLDAQLGQGNPEFLAYSAAKAGLAQATADLALALAPRIRVNAVAPGHVLWAEQSQLSDAQQQAELARVPMQRLAKVEEIAAAVSFLMSQRASFITGAVLPVDGGLRLA